MSETILLCEKTYQLKEIRYEDLIILFHTGRNEYLGGTGSNKKYRYRTGVNTNLGDIEINEWETAVEKLIEFNGDTAHYNDIMQKIKIGFPWLKTDSDRKIFALDLFLREKSKPQKVYD